jgi:hypothetical protein
VVATTHPTHPLLTTVLGRFDTYKGGIRIKLKKSQMNKNEVGKGESTGWVRGMGECIATFNIHISHVKRITSKTKMMGLRSPGNCFWFFFYLFT